MAIQVGKVDNHIGVNLTDVDATAKHRVGTIVFTDYGGKFVYGVAAAAITGEGYLCVFDVAYAATMVTYANTVTAPKVGAQLGSPMAAIASGSYGWFQVSGIGTVQVTASTAVGTSVNTSTTAGSINAAGTGSATGKITGIFVPATISSGLGVVVYTDPIIGTGN